MGRLSANHAESEYHQIPKNSITAHLYARARGTRQIWLRLRFPAGVWHLSKEEIQKKKEGCFPNLRKKSERDESS